MAHILLVEDHPLVGQVLSEAIEDAGHTADYVTTKAAAERLLGTHTHALAVIDVHLPDGSGRDLAMCAASLGLETFLITADPDQAVAMKQMRITHLVKPFGTRELLARIRAVLRRSSPDAR